MTLDAAEIPSHWKIVPIEQVAFFQEGPGVRKYQYTDSGVKLLNGGNINDGILDLRTTDRFIAEEEAYGKYNHFLVEPGDLLIACSGVVVEKFDGKIAYARKEHLPLCMNTSTMRFRSLNEKVLHLDYFRRFLQSSYFKKQLQKLITGSAQLNFGPSHIKQMQIPLPPLSEQKRIAAILDKADAIRRKRQQAIKLADEFLRSVFLDMFGPTVANNKWEQVSFDEVTLVDAKMVDPRETEYLDLLHIGPDRIEKNTGKLLPALTAREENLISKKFLFDQSYVLYSKIRPYLRKVALPDFEGLCSADMYPVRPKDGLLTREYLWQLLLSDEFTKYTQTLPDRANIPKLNRNELAAFTFRLPPIELQREFSLIFEKYNKFLLGSHCALEFSENNFSAVSQRAFSGQL